MTTHSTLAHKKATELTRLALEMTAAAGSGHPTSAASLAHVVTTVVYGAMRFDPACPEAPAADRLVLSEGHACPIVYAAAADLGIAIGHGEGRRPMTRADAMRLREIDAAVDGHPNPVEGFPFFPTATGSLGQGLSVAAGVAYAARLDGTDRRVYCIVGDGESREGQVWEALDFIIEQSLSTVCTIFNCNGYGQTDAVSDQQSWKRLSKKLRAFGFEVEDVDGHDPDALREALRRHARRAESAAGSPIAIVARTTKGWGSPSLQGGGHHGKPATGDELDKALQELDETARRLGADVPGSLRGPRRPQSSASPGGVTAPRADVPQTLDAALASMDRADSLRSGEMATRDAFGVALPFIGRADAGVVVLDGDVSNSTRAAGFAQDADLAPRFIQCRIAEQNMMSCAAGLAAGGKTPFVTTFGKFLVRAFDQLEMSLVGGHPLKLVGSHTGVSLAADGPSQMGLIDVAFFRALAGALRDDQRPSLHVLNPCDARSAYALTVAAARHDGAVYLRTMRPETPLVHAPDTEFEIGGFEVLEEGEDLVIVSWGFMVHEARRACSMLRERGTTATLVDAYSIPFAPGAFAALVARDDVPVLTVEDNYAGALGSAVAEVVAATGPGRPLHQMFVRSVPKSGREPSDLLEHLGLSAEHIVQRAEELLQLA